MRIIVTGGAGYIGSVLVDELVKEHEVLVIDNLSTGHMDAINLKAHFIDVDLGEAIKTITTISSFNPDVIIHMASYCLVGESMIFPMKYLRENVVNGLNVLSGVVRANVPKFILSSTCNIYEPMWGLTEKDTVLPQSPYGEGKYFLEKCLLWLAKTKGLKYGILRYFNAAGATEIRGEEHNPETHLIPNVIKAALTDEDVIVHGDDYCTFDGTCIRDYIHVSDIASAHLLTLEAIESENKIYNLGSDKGYSVLDIIRKTKTITNKEIKVKVGPKRDGDPAILIANSSKIRSELEWSSPNSNLDTIIQTAYNWHKNHPTGY